MAVKNSFLPIPLTNIASSALTSSYQAINTGFPHPLAILRLNSTSTTSVTVSYDGTNDHEFLLAGADLTLQFQTNSQPNTYIGNMAAGTIVYVKGTAGTGNIYVGGYYQPQAN